MSSRQGKILLQWECSEFETHARGTAWYFWMTLIGGAVLLSALLTGNFLFALIIIIIVMLLILYERRGPRTLLCQIREDGVAIGDTLYSYQEVRDFRIVYQPPVIKKMYLGLSSVVRPHVSVLLMEQDPEKIREILASYILEDTDNTGETVSDTVSRIFKL